MNRSIVLLASGNVVSKALARQLNLIGADLVLIVPEDAPVTPRKKPKSRIARRMHGNGLVAIAAGTRLPSDVRGMRRAEQRLQEAAMGELHYLKLKGIPAEWPAGIPVQRTRSINNEDTVARIRAARPELIVIYGTRLLREPMISSAHLGAVNAHSSLLPAYRGMRPEFWQCYRSDPAGLGLTVHVADTGMDTGDILFARSTATHWPTDPFRSRTRNIISRLENHPRVDQDHLDGRTTPARQERNGVRACPGREITMEKRIELMDRLARW